MTTKLRLLTCVIPLIVSLQSSLAEAGKFSGLGQATSSVLGRAGARSLANAKQPELTRDSLRSCVVLDERIKTDAMRLGAERKALEAESLTLHQIEAELNSRRSRLTSNAAVNRFNASVADWNSKARVHDSRVASFNANLEAHRKDADQFDNQCASRTYRESDMQAVHRELGRRS